MSIASQDAKSHISVSSVQRRAARTFTDEYGITRRAGEEWLLTIKECETHVCDVHEEACADIPHSKYLLVRGHSDVSHQHLEAMLYNTDEHKLSFVLFFRV